MSTMDGGESTQNNAPVCLAIPEGGSSRPRERQEYFRRRLYLVGVTLQPEIQAFLRGNCIPEEVGRMEHILAKWRSARDCFRKIEAEEAGLPEEVRIEEPDPTLASFFAEVSGDRLFQASFGRCPIEIRKVELDKLVACQRHVDLDYVEHLKAELVNGMLPEEHARFCLLPRTAPPAPKQQQLGPNVYGFSSPNPDFRFLGGFARPLVQEDVDVCWAGGQPIAAVVLLVGYGAPAMNAYQAGRRLILNNGFHRAYALRSAGVGDAYLVIQHIEDPEREFPANLLGLPKDYLLKNQRPGLIKDFFNPALVEEVRTSVGVRSIQLVWDANQSLVPV